MWVNCVSVCVSVCGCVCGCVSECVVVCVGVCVWMCVCACVCVDVCVHVCVCVWMCVWVCTVNKPKATGCSNYCAHTRLYKSYIEELTAVLPHIGDDKKFKPLSYATVPFLMMDQ